MPARRRNVGLALPYAHGCKPALWVVSCGRASFISGAAGLCSLSLPLLLVVFPAAVLPHAHGTDIYLTALAMLLTLVYAAGLLFRPQRRMARMGVDSLVVLLLYTLGVAGLIAIATSG